jgi:prepilin-type N-terminal cleavage/methylation domain-containing protein
MSVLNKFMGDIKRMKQQSGFTLVEIAIVLVIIGLLLGGVLKGQELINNARAKNIENEVNNIKTAIYSYQDRYRAFPGDDKKADRFTDIGTCPTSKLCGDSDGNIEGIFDSTTANVESRLFWLHLRNAGLIAGATDDQAQPNNVFNGLIGVSTTLKDKGVDIPGVYIGFSNIPENIALIIESRLDDGKPNSGSIQAQKNDGSQTDANSYKKGEFYRLYFAL